MTSHHALLDNITHKNLRILTEFRSGLGDDTPSTVVFPLELRALQNEYPLFFRPASGDAGFEPIALLGFEDGENIFLSDTGWDAHAIPLTIQRKPFLIGFTSGDYGSEDKPVIHVDMDSPRVSEDIGEAVFTANGDTTDYIEGISSILQAIHNGHRENQDLVQTLREFELIEAVSLEISLDNGVKRTLRGLHTIAEARLRELPAGVLGTLQRKGFLEAIYMMLASQTNIPKLIARKNAQLAIGP